MQIKKLGGYYGCFESPFFFFAGRDVREFGVGKKHMKFSR